MPMMQPAADGLPPDTWCLIRVPADDTRYDGAVVELHLEPDGIFTGEVRIPGPPAP